MAEEVGFEPTEPFDSAVFKTGAFNRSATLPKLVPLDGIEPPNSDYKTEPLPLRIKGLAA